MPNKIGSFAIVGLRDVKVIDNLGEVVTKLKHGKDIDISNESSTSYLRGGEGNKKLLAISGDSSATITINTATMTTKLWEIITGNIMTTETRPVQVEKTATITTNKITLDGTPSVGAKMTIFTVDAFGRDDVLLALGDPTTTVNTYSVSGSTVTFHNGTSGKVHVYYSTDKEVQVITSKPNVAKNYRFEATLLLKDVETKESFIGNLIVGNGKIQENYNLGGANESTEPSPIPLVIDCMEDSSTGKFYEILFYDDVA